MKSKKEGFIGERQVKLPPMIIELEKNDPLTASLYITDIGYYPKAENHHIKRSCPIKQYVLIYCVEGCGWFTINNTKYEVKQNQYFILPNGVPHEYGSAQNKHWTIYWLHFSGEHAPIYSQGATIPSEINVTLNSRIGYRISIFEEILYTLQRQNNIEDLRYASSLLHHFLASMRYLQQYRGANNELNIKNNINVVDAAIHYMKENIENKIKLKDVLEYTGYASSHFNTLFKSQTGCSPLQYFNKIKVEYACKMLTNTNLKINQICFKLGIEDSLYFSRLFRKITGMPPSKFRETAKLDNKDHKDTNNLNFG